jgi:hypothetical protein
LGGRAESRKGQRPDRDEADRGVMGGRGHGRIRRRVGVDLTVEGVRGKAPLDRVQRVMDGRLDRRQGPGLHGRVLAGHQGGLDGRDVPRRHPIGRRAGEGQGQDEDSRPDQFQTSGTPVVGAHE